MNSFIEKLFLYKFLLFFVLALLLGCNVGFFDDNRVKICDGEEYKPSTYFCSSGIIYELCGGRSYNIENQICENGVVKPWCGNSGYNTETHFCSNGVIYKKCSNKDYNPENQICENEIIKTKCGTGINYHDPKTQFCYENDVFDKCKGEDYNALTQFCSGQDTVIYNKCGDLVYNTEAQFCYYEILMDRSKGIFIDRRDDNIYKYVGIGNQIWMAENLKYEISSAICYDDNPENCESFGMLYNWNTAKEICPTGWHLPSEDEWRILINYAGGIDIAGTKLKANSIFWGSDNGTDDFGFAALPSGLKNGNFFGMGQRTNFWNTYYSKTGLYGTLALYTDDFLNLGYTTSGWSYISVRCIKD